MKKQKYRNVNVLPSPAPSTISNKLSLLPATILTLTVALSPADKEVLAYLISSCSSNGNLRKTKKGVVGKYHQPKFSCRCFHCYGNYWIRWNTSSNHNLIHDIINAYEDHSLAEQNSETTDKNNASVSASAELELVKGSGVSSYDAIGGGDEEKDGSMRRLVSYFGERICELLLCLSSLNRLGIQKMGLYSNGEPELFCF